MESVSCVICRRRKIKCDRRPIACANCAKFGTPCSYAASGATSASGPGLGTTRRAAVLSSSPTTTQAGLQRRRILRSCAACKRAKAKCSGGATCARCTRRSMVCVYEGGRREAGPRPSVVDAAATEDPPDSFPSPVSAELEARLPSSPVPSIPGVPSAVPGWLAAPELPPMDRLRGLIDGYFARIHPLRCMGFLHMPTFLERLRDPPTLYADEYGLVHAICALAAPFLYADSAMSATSGTPATPPRLYEAGAGWAATAMQRVFHHLGTPDVESLMTEMLVHEYYLRSGEYARAFLLSGVVARHVQVLQLNLEHDCDLRRASSDGGALSWATKESRRRLAWCCFLQDAFMECGIDQLRFVNPADLQVQLPCTEELFVRGRPCVTEMLPPGRLLPFAVDREEDRHDKEEDARRNLDLRAFYVRAMAVRARVLKYVKQLRGDVPWSEDPRASRFARLDGELRALEASLPDELRMRPENTCVLRWSGRLGLFFGLHILLAQTATDLYRVGVANLVFPHHATHWIRAHAPRAFLVRCHATCTARAVAVASLLEELWQTDRLSLVDTPYAMHAQVCSSVLVMTMSSWQALCRRAGNLDLDPEAVPVDLPRHHRLLQSNVAILDFLRSYIKADLYYESARQALRRFEQLGEEAARAGVEDAAPSADGTADSTTATATAVAEAPQFSLEYILNPLGVYPMARQQARNRHEPQASATPSSAPTAEASTQAAYDTPAALPPPSTPRHEPQQLLPPPPAMLDATDAGESSLFQMWDWESEVPSMDNMGYPTFLEFQETA